MKLVKINVTVSNEAKNVLIKYQEANGYNNLDSALDAMLLECRHGHPITSDDAMQLEFQRRYSLASDDDESAMDRGDD